MQLLLYTKVLSLLLLHLAERVDLKSPLTELEVGLLVEVVVVGRLKDAIEDLELSSHYLAVPSWVWQRRC